MNKHNDTVPADMPINTRAAWRPLLKPIGRFLVAAQLALVLQPLSAAVREGPAYNPMAEAQVQRYAQLSQTIEQAKVMGAANGKGQADQVSDKLGQAQELVAQLKSQYTPDKQTRHQQLKDLLTAIRAGTADVRADFAATRTELQRKNLPAEILARHDEAVGQFEQRAANFGQIVSGAASDDERVAKLAEFFDKYPAKRKPGKFDPKKLPWSTPQPNTRLPAETQTGWFQNLWGDRKVQLAQAGGASIGPLQFNIPPEPGQAPTPADLAQTDEVQITPEIRAKAQELGNNPVAIYNWVRNTIEWAPTAGAIQSAQDTLDKKRGNATDTASLLVALLRAANVPARYQWGTIDVPAAKAMNWVGGATVPQAALQLIAQGGIAARGLASGGVITTIRMEHVWVQAYVNWAPSRGSRNATDGQHPNPNANLNAWVPLDASFKQYTYAPGMDLKTAVPLDANALLNAARQGATVNEAEGWVQNLNQAAIQSQLADYQNRLKTYIDSQNANATVGDVIGKKIIPQSVQSLLAATLANPVVVQTSQASAVPSSQQHKFTYRLYASDYDQANDSPMLSYTEKTSKLVGKRLTLTYLPASQADTDLIASYMPKPHADGSAIQPSELPTSLPGYLIRLKAQMNLDGQVVSAAATSLPMGTDLYSTGGFTQLYDTNQWDLTSEETNAAGNATAIGISAGGVSEPQIVALKDRMRQNRALPGAVSPTIAAEQFATDFLALTIWTWFAASESQNRISQSGQGIVEKPGLSHGLFHVQTQPLYAWGVIRKVTYPGVNLDIGHVRNLTWAQDNSLEKWISYNEMRGQFMSALEAAVAAQLFADTPSCASPDAPCPRGISSINAIGLAEQSGQKIYHITQELYQSNPAVATNALANLSQSARDRIRQALDAGHRVTFHARPVTQNGWSGAGFILIDPSSGAGAYLIDGGANGGTASGDFGQRYLAWVCDHMITDPAVLSLLLLLMPFSTVPKSLFDLSATALGGSNLYTTVLRAIAVLFSWATISAFAKTVGALGFGPFILGAIIFVGFFNVSTLFLGLFYAAIRRDNLGGSLVLDGSGGMVRLAASATSAPAT